MIMKMINAAAHSAHWNGRKTLFTQVKNGSPWSRSKINTHLLHQCVFSSNSNQDNATQDAGLTLQSSNNTAIGSHCHFIKFGVVLDHKNNAAKHTRNQSYVKINLQYWNQSHSTGNPLSAAEVPVLRPWVTHTMSGDQAAAAQSPEYAICNANQHWLPIEGQVVVSCSLCCRVTHTQSTAVVIAWGRLLLRLPCFRTKRWKDALCCSSK